jgi:hypothetical protein
MVELLTLLGFPLDILKQLVLTLLIPTDKTINLNRHNLIPLKIKTLINLTKPSLPQQLQSLVLVIHYGPLQLRILTIHFLVSQFQLFLIKIDGVLGGLELFLENKELL